METRLYKTKPWKILYFKNWIFWGMDLMLIKLVSFTVGGSRKALEILVKEFAYDF